MSYLVTDIFYFLQYQLDNVCFLNRLDDGWYFIAAGGTPSLGEIRVVQSLPLCVCCFWVISLIKWRKNISHYRISSKTQSKNGGNRAKIDIPNTHIHDCSLSWLRTVTSMETGYVNLVICARWCGDESVFHMWVKRQHLHITWRASLEL